VTDSATFATPEEDEEEAGEDLGAETVEQHSFGKSKHRRIALLQGL
jgi:hypothetical protein